MTPLPAPRICLADQRCENCVRWNWHCGDDGRGTCTGDDPRETTFDTWCGLWR